MVIWERRIPDRGNNRFKSPNSSPTAVPAELEGSGCGRNIESQRGEVGAGRGQDREGTGITAYRSLAGVVQTLMERKVLSRAVTGAGFH